MRLATAAVAALAGATLAAGGTVAVLGEGALPGHGPPSGRASAAGHGAGQPVGLGSGQGSDRGNGSGRGNRSVGIASRAGRPPDLAAAGAGAGTPLGRLQSSLDRVLAGRRACLVVDDGGQRVVDLNPGLPLVPASTQKLLVAAAALAVLGPGYRFRTEVVGSGPVTAGTVGQLWLVGGGDPLVAGPDYGAWLATQPRYLGAPVTPIASLAAQLRASGVARVPGGIHGDASLYSTPTALAVWTPGELAEGDAGALSALSVDEGWQSWQPLYVPAPDPAAEAASQLASLLGAGAAAAPGPDSSPPARSPVLATVASAPLSQIVAFMLRSSDNTTAEMLTLAIGRRLEASGTTAAGTAGVLATDRRLGIPTAGVSLQDGSGLAPGDQATCAALLGALDLASRPGLGTLAQGLAVAGEDGTLVNRFVGSPLQGRLQAKDGFLDGVAAMVGTLEVGRPVSFALVANGPGPFNYAVAESIEAGVLGALEAYSTAPLPADGRPAAAAPGRRP